MQFKIPATSANLGPGFDTLGLALGLYNKITIKPAKIQSIHVEGEGTKNTKIRVDNAFVKIFNEQLRRLKIEKQNFKFTFENSIPISRGLGSSSAVIVGAISAAFKIAKKEINKEEILNIALYYESHPDNITPALIGGFNVCMLMHRQVRFINKKLPDTIKAVIAIPQQSISTHHSRQTLPKRYSQKDAIFNLSHSTYLASAFFKERWDLLREASMDRFHQFYRMKQVPILFDLQKTALNSGALMSTLSGSGSTFFNLCYSDDADRLHAVLENKFKNIKILTLPFDNNGVSFEEF